MPKIAWQQQPLCLNSDALADLCYTALLLLIQQHNMRWSQASSGAAGHHLCQAATAVISGVASILNKVRMKGVLCCISAWSPQCQQCFSLGQNINAVLEG